MRHGWKQVEERRKVISVSLGGKDFQFLDAGFLICNLFYVRFFFFSREVKNSSDSLYTELKYIKCIGSQFLFCSSVSESVDGARNNGDSDLI